MRPRNTQDSPTPSDNSLALEALQFHIALTGDLEARREFDTTMASLAADALTHPAFGGYALAVWLTHLVGVKEVAIVGAGEDRDVLTRPVWGQFRPNVVLAIGDGSAATVPLLADRTCGDGALAYVCEGLTCDLPVSTPEALATKL